jgi:hypothetical protein
MLTSALARLEATALARFIAESSWAFPTVETAHVLFLVLVVGTIAIVDLRLLGWASTNRRVTDVVRDIVPVTWICFVFALASGALLFVSSASAYAANPAFQLKLLLLLLAGANMLMFHLVTYRRIAAWDAHRTPPVGARIAGALSLALWIAIVVCGRWIGFT